MNSLKEPFLPVHNNQTNAMRAVFEDVSEYIYNIHIFELIIYFTITHIQNYWHLTQNGNNEE